MKIDVFPHILPKKYFDRLLAVAPPGLALQKRMSGIPVLVDLDLRLAMMDRWDGYVQVLTLAVASGSWGGRCLSLADYVRGPAAPCGATAAARA